MTIIRYTLYKFPATKNLPCPGCGKKIRRSRTFTGTSNPYSTPPYMTRQQMAEHRAPEIASWQVEPVWHPACRPFESCDES